MFVENRRNISIANSHKMYLIRVKLKKKSTKCNFLIQKKRYLIVLHLNYLHNLGKLITANVSLMVLGN